VSVLPPSEPSPARASAPAPPTQGGVFRAALRGRGPAGILGMVVVVGLGGFGPLNALLLPAWVGLTRTPWRAFGFVRPRSWVGTAVGGVTLGVTLKLALKSVVLPLLGAPPTNAAFHDLAGNTAALPGTLFDVIVGAGFGEEAVFRGFWFERLGVILGRGRIARIVTVAVTSAWFAFLHVFRQGAMGAEQAAITGLVFGTIFAATGGIWLLMIAHAAFDVTAVYIIYAGLETRVAHWFFH
jgi:membrane protease YdiL (CAAX protease family)